MLLTPLAAATSSMARCRLWPMVGGRVEQDHAVGGGQEGRLVGAVGDPVEVPLDPADVVALVVEGGAERRARDRRVVGQGVGAASAQVGDVAVVGSGVLIEPSLSRRPGEPDRFPLAGIVAATARRSNPGIP